MIGFKVKMNKHFKDILVNARPFSSEEHIEEFGDCIGTIVGWVDYGSQLGPEVDVRWQPSNLRYAYHPINLDLVEQSEDTCSSCGAIVPANWEFCLMCINHAED